VDDMDEGGGLKSVVVDDEDSLGKLASRLRYLIYIFV